MNIASNSQLNWILRYPTSELPTSDAGLKEWVNDLWQQKEQRLVEFYCNRTFTPQQENTSAPTSNPLLLALLFWTGVVVLTLYLLCTSLYMQLWSLLHCTIFLLLSFTSEGIHQLEASWFKTKPDHEKKWPSVSLPDAYFWVAKHKIFFII